MTINWELVILALIAAVPATLAAITGVITALKLGEVHKQINSRMDQLVASTAKASRAEGVASEKESVLKATGEVPLSLLVTPPAGGGR